jgi:hypothetical protein
LVWWVFVTSFRVDFKNREKKKDGSSHEEEENVWRWHTVKGVLILLLNLFLKCFLFKKY